MAEITLKEAMELLKECRAHVKAYKHKMMIGGGVGMWIADVNSLLSRLDAALKEAPDAD